MKLKANDWTIMDMQGQDPRSGDDFPTPEPSGSGPEYADIGTRMIAGLIDGLILVIPVTILGLALMFLMGPFVNVAGVLLWWLYASVLMSGNNQATIGQKAMGILTTDLSGNRLTRDHAYRRNGISAGISVGFSVLSFVTPLSGILALGWLAYTIYTMVTTEKKQTPWDIWGDTVVIVGKVQ